MKEIIRPIMLIILLVIPAPELLAESKTDRFVVPKPVAAVVSKHCLACHGAQTSEGNVRFDTLAELKQSERLELLNKAQEPQGFVGATCQN